MRHALSILELLRAAGGRLRLPTGRAGRRYRLTVELQENFALNQPLSPCARGTGPAEPQVRASALDVGLKLMEATLEKPPGAERAGEEVKGEALLAAMKAEGPGVHGAHARTGRSPAGSRSRSCWTRRWSVPGVRPVGVPSTAVDGVRDMSERAVTLGTGGERCGLARSEGILLRYLWTPARALRQTVPVDARRRDPHGHWWSGSGERPPGPTATPCWTASWPPAGLSVRRERRLPGGAASREQPGGDLQPAGVPRDGVATAAPARGAVGAGEDKVLGALDERVRLDRDRWAGASTLLHEYEDVYRRRPVRGPSLIRITSTRGSPGFSTVVQVFDSP
ncbi:DUF3516 domain-containing protein [Kocuria rhizophila]|nr:DUF3516 domain-containing protein [Kocuria rhizophila]